MARSSNFSEPRVSGVMTDTGMERSRNFSDLRVRGVMTDTGMARSSYFSELRVSGVMTDTGRNTGIVKDFPRFGGTLRHFGFLK